MGTTELRDATVGALRAAGCVAVGVCGVEPLVEARATIEARRSEGLDAGMQFTYRNPGRSTDPRRALPSARAAVVAAMPYRTAMPPPPPSPSAMVARYAAQDTYGVLRAALRSGGEVLERAGHRAVVLADDNALVDRAIARRAGLGWLGKNTNLLVPGVGSWVVLGTVLTDAPLPPGPSAGDGTGIEDCGACRRCLDGCPTGALVAPGVLDGSRCLSWLLQTKGPFPVEYREALGHRIYGCDDCQEVCPPNRRAGDPVPEGGATGDTAEPRTPGDWVEVAFLLEASDDDLMDRVGAWYVPGRDPRYVRRNALVVLGNVGDGDDPLVVRLLQRYLRSGDPLLAEHARWAARAVGRGDLVPPEPSGETGGDGRP